MKSRTMDSMVAVVEVGKGLGCIGMRRGDSMVGMNSCWSLLRRLGRVILGPGRTMAAAAVAVAVAKIHPAATSVPDSWICILSIPSFCLRCGVSWHFHNLHLLTWLGCWPFASASLFGFFPNVNIIVYSCEKRKGFSLITCELELKSCMNLWLSWVCIPIDC